MSSFGILIFQSKRDMTRYVCWIRSLLFVSLLATGGWVFRAVAPYILGDIVLAGVVTTNILSTARWSLSWSSCMLSVSLNRPYPRPQRIFMSHHFSRPKSFHCDAMDQGWQPFTGGRRAAGVSPAGWREVGPAAGSPDLHLLLDMLCYIIWQHTLDQWVL